MMRFFKFICIIIFILYALGLNAASLGITEIMYDLEGSDSGHEWVEIYNNTGESIDLTKYKFVESGSAHNINHYSGSIELPNDSYAVIADNPTNFLNDYSNFKIDQLYDSSFSLSNDKGESLAIKNVDGEIINEITYNVTLGANGDGKSLQQNSSGVWVASIPTPGNKIIEPNTTSPENLNTTPTISSTSNKETTQKESTMHFVFDIPENAIVGSKIIFKNTLYGFSGERINTGLFTWNFGDGQTITQNTNQNVEHIYAFPGNYTVTCSYKYGSWYNGTIAMDRVRVSVVESPLVFKDLYTDPYPAIRIINNSNSEYNISNYIIKTATANIIIPEGSFIGAKDDIVINLPAGIYSKNELELVTPAGYRAATFPGVPLSNTIKNDNLLSNFNETKPIAGFLLANASIGYNNPNEILENSTDNQIINLDNSPKNSNTGFNWTYLYLLCIIVVSSIVLIYIRSKISNNKNSEITDEYALQDE